MMITRAVSASPLSPLRIVGWMAVCQRGGFERILCNWCSASSWNFPRPFFVKLRRWEDAFRRRKQRQQGYFFFFYSPSPLHQALLVTAASPELMILGGGHEEQQH